MQIVIDIDEELYEEVKGYHELTECELAIFNGTVLKPHGRCVDVDGLKTDGTIADGDADLFAVTWLQIDIAPTILEAWEGNEE